MQKKKKKERTYALLLGVDALEHGPVPRTLRQLLCGDVKLPYEAVVPVLVVVEALDLDVPLYVPVAQGAQRDAEPLPLRVQVGLDDLGAVDDDEAAVLGRAGELQEGVGGAEQVLPVQLPPGELQLEVVLGGGELLGGDVQRAVARHPPLLLVDERHGVGPVGGRHHLGQRARAAADEVVVRQAGALAVDVVHAEPVVF